MDELVRRRLGYGDRYDLPSRYWEPEPDEEDMKLMEQICEDNEFADLEIPFE